MKKIKFLVLILFLQSWIFYNVLSATPIQSEPSNPQENRFSVKTSSNEAFSRFLNETQVNNYTTNNQEDPSICALSNDKFAVAWTSHGQDEAALAPGVYASVFDATTGNNITREFRVNYYTTDDQWEPSICALSSDMLAVAWQSYGQDEAATDGVYARVFNATTGNNITREFRVNDYTTSDQYSPSICALSSDTFAVAWQSYGQDEATTDGVYARVFNATTGNNITREFRVNHYTQNNQWEPSICRLSSDTLAVAWSSFGQDGSLFGIHARVFNATTGNNITREFQVNYFPTNTQRDPSICALSSDMFAVAWYSQSHDSDGSVGVYARIFNATTGNNITREFQINHYEPNTQDEPSICRLSNDTFAVAWTSYGQDLDNEGVYASVFNATTGNNITREFQVNYNKTNNQNSPSICCLSSDSFAVAWHSEVQDSGTAGVYVSIFGDPSTSLPSSSAPALVPGGDDDDDDDDDEFEHLVPLLILIGIGSAIVIIGVMIYLIKKKGR